MYRTDTTLGVLLCTLVILLGVLLCTVLTQHCASLAQLKLGSDNWGNVDATHLKPLHVEEETLQPSSKSELRLRNFGNEIVSVEAWAQKRCGLSRGVGSPF